MFDSINKVKIYERALKLLADPALGKAKVALHDYDSECYRSDPVYTLNGLHWGYPDALVASITRKDPEGTGGNLSDMYAAFVDKTPKYQRERFKENSRYKIVAYSKVKKIVELGIKQKLEESRSHAAEEMEALSKWKAICKRDFAKFKGFTVRFESAGDKAFRLIILKPERFKTMGMGTFSPSLKKGDVSIAGDASAAIDNMKSDQGGMFLFEGFGDDVVRFGGLFDVDTVIPSQAANANGDFLSKLRSVAVISDNA